MPITPISIPRTNDPPVSAVSPTSPSSENVTPGCAARRSGSSRSSISASTAAVLARRVSTSPRSVTVRRRSTRAIRLHPRASSNVATEDSGTCVPSGRVNRNPRRSSKLSWLDGENRASTSKFSPPTCISNAAAPWKPARNWRAIAAASSPRPRTPGRARTRYSGLPGRRSAVRFSTPSNRFSQASSSPATVFNSSKSRPRTRTSTFRPEGPTPGSVKFSATTPGTTPTFSRQRAYSSSKVTVRSSPVRRAAETVTTCGPASNASAFSLKRA